MQVYQHILYQTPAHTVPKTSTFTPMQSWSVDTPPANTKTKHITPAHQSAHATRAHAPDKIRLGGGGGVVLLASVCQQCQHVHVTLDKAAVPSAKTSV